MAPQVPPDLAGVALQLQTDGGEIHVQWSQGNATSMSRNGSTNVMPSGVARFALSVTVPVSTHAQLCIPTFGQSAVSAHIIEGNNSTWLGGKFVAGSMTGCTGASVNNVVAPGRGLEICFACGCGSYDLVLLDA